MNWAFLFVSLLLPALVGVVLLRTMPAVTMLRGHAVILGYGYLIGIAAVTAFMRLWDAVGLRFHFSQMATALTALSAIVFLTSKVLQSEPRPSGAAGTPPIRSGVLESIAFWLFAGLIVAHLLGAGIEIVLRPLYPWDAWSAWGFKARVWFEQAAMVPIVDADAWLAAADPGIYTNKAHHYPPMVSLIQTWTALAIGYWDDTLINLPWVLCAAALGVGFFGQSRELGSSPLVAMMFTYLVLSLPLLDTHVALAGYADLWLASAFSLAGIAALTWGCTHRAGQGMLALLLALVCSQIKLEGLVWALTLVPAGLVTMAGRGRKLLSIVLTLSVLLAITGLVIALIEPKLLTETSIAEKIAATLRHEPPPSEASVGLAIARNLFLMGNWNLLWYLFAASFLVLPLLWRSGYPRLVGFGLLVVSTMALPVYVFFFTGAFRWAVDYTALNRFLLHLAPLYVFMIQLVWVQTQNGCSALGATDPHDLGSDSFSSNRYSRPRPSR